MVRVGERLRLRFALRPPSLELGLPGFFVLQPIVKILHALSHIGIFGLSDELCEQALRALLSFQGIDRDRSYDRLLGADLAFPSVRILDRDHAICLLTDDGAQPALLKLGGASIW